MSAFERRIRDAEEEIRRLPRERVYIFDVNGSVVFMSEGGENFAFIPDPIARGRLVLHNHPNGESFSRQDIETLLRVQAAEFRLVTGRHRFRIALPQGVVWREIEGYVNQLYFEELEAANDRMTARMATAEEAAREILHRVWVRISETYGWEYRREEIDDEYADEHA